MKKGGFLLIFLANLTVIVIFWLSQSGRLLFSTPSDLLIALGRIAGLLAVYLILWQLVLIGRVKLLEQAFGLDRLVIIHHYNGLAAWALIFLHPIFIIIGYGLAGSLGFFGQMKDFFLNWPGLVPAFAAVLIFLVVIILSWGAIQRRLKYEAWHYIHLFTYLAIIFAFSHQLALGGDFHNVWFVAYWYVLYFEALAFLLVFRFSKPLYLFARHRFYVDRVETVNDRTISVFLKGRNLEKYLVRPGQFAIFRFLDWSLLWEAHPFSFSQVANGKELRVTIKALGDFTRDLPKKLKPGTAVVIDGPHGIFTIERTESKKLALLAGGIGITPIRPLAEKARAEGRDLVIFCATGVASEILFRAELEKMSEPNCRVIFIVSQDETWTGEKGRIDKDKIVRLMPDYAERDFFICGPPRMVKGLRLILKDLKIKAGRIYFEKFSL